MQSGSISAYRAAAEAPDYDEDLPGAHERLHCGNCGGFLSPKNSKTETFDDEPGTYFYDADGNPEDYLPGRPGGTRISIPCKRCGKTGWSVED